jgi:hypothetical protein
MMNSNTFYNLKFFIQFLNFYFFSKIKNRELPSSIHTVPNDFIGINIASNDEIRTDQFIIDKILDLKIKNLRIHFSYLDFNTHKARLIHKLDSYDGQLIINLSPPPNDSSSLSNDGGLLIWNNFIKKFFEEFKNINFSIEIGSTINRFSWSQLTFKNTLKIWSATYHLCKLNNKKIIGPNITDFEPFVNYGFYKILSSKHQLPDALTNNMFVERTIEPEPFDGRVFLRKYPNLLKFDLYKKLSVYKHIASKFGVNSLISPCSFWSIKRIKRLSDYPEQKRSKYITRYFLMVAAEGSFNQAFWGPLICNREGLIDDGEKDYEYPNLEQVTFYDKAKGYLSNYKITESYKSLRFFNNTIPDAKFIKNYSEKTNIHILEFQTNTEIIHTLWTQNNYIANLKHHYFIDDLDRVIAKNKYGEIQDIGESITDDPIYLFWPKNEPPSIIQKPQIVKDIFISSSNEDYYHLFDEQWEGLIQAKNKDEYQLILNHCHPNKLNIPDKKDSLRKSRNVVWIKNIPNYGKVVIKKPLKIYKHKKFLDRNRPSKSTRSWNGSQQLISKDINCAKPIAVFNKKNDSSSIDNFYICLHRSGYTFNDLANHFKKSNVLLNFTKRQIFEECAIYVNKMHSRGLFFSDLSGGNILLITNNNSFYFELIDTGRVKNFNSSLKFSNRLNLRIKDIERLLNKFDWEIRNIFLKKYFLLNNKKLNLYTKYSLLIYDFLVRFKRFRKKLIKL